MAHQKVRQQFVYTEIGGSNLLTIEGTVGLVVAGRSTGLAGGAADFSRSVDVDKVVRFLILPRRSKPPRMIHERCRAD
jgi:hypothetical protein